MTIKTSQHFMTATLTLATENAWLWSGLSRPRSGKRLQVQMGPDSAEFAEKTGDPRGAWSAEVPGSRLRSRPPLSLHSPEARAGSPSAEAPRGRRLQRRGRRRIMRQHGRAGWTRIRSVPLGSVRPGRCAGSSSSQAEGRARRRA